MANRIHMALEDKNKGADSSSEEALGKTGNSLFLVSHWQRWALQPCLCPCRLLWLDLRQNWQEQEGQGKPFQLPFLLLPLSIPALTNGSKAGRQGISIPWRRWTLHSSSSIVGLVLSEKLLSGNWAGQDQPTVVIESIFRQDHMWQPVEKIPPGH